MPLITLGELNQLRLKIPSKGDLNWSDDFKTQFAQKIVEHDHTGIDGKGKQLTGDSLADGSINRASLMAIDLQDLPNVTDTLSDPNDPTSNVYQDGAILKYSRATNTWIPGPEGEIYINISQDAQVESFSPGSFVSVTTIDNLSPTTSDPKSQYWLDFTGQSSFKSIFLLINLTNPTTQKVILPSMEACTIVSNVDVDLEGDLINCDITVRREGGFCTTTMGSTAKMEGCEGDFDKVISGSHTGSDLSRFIQSTITADELQAQLTDNDPNTLVVDQSEVVIDLLSNSASLSTSAEYLKLQNKAQVTVKQFDATFPVDATRVNLADAYCLLLSRGGTNDLTTWNGTRFNHLASPSNINKFITADSSGDPVDFNVPVGSVPVARSGGFSTEEYKLAALDDYSSTINITNINNPIAYNPDTSSFEPSETLSLNTIVNKNTSGTTDLRVHNDKQYGDVDIKSNNGAIIVRSTGTTTYSNTPSANTIIMERVRPSIGSDYMALRVVGRLFIYNNSGTQTSSYGYNSDVDGTLTVGSTSTFNSTSNFNSTANFNYTAGSYSAIFDDSINVTGTVYCIGLSQSSDYRLKDNVHSLQNASALLMQLNPCRYTWKEDGKEDIGFIAHEVQEVLPEIVYGEKDGLKEDGSIEKQGIDYSKLTSLLTASLQEALVKIDSLEARIKELEDKE